MSTVFYGYSYLFTQVSSIMILLCFFLTFLCLLMGIMERIKFKKLKDKHTIVKGLIIHQTELDTSSNTFELTYIFNDHPNRSTLLLLIEEYARIVKDTTENRLYMIIPSSIIKLIAQFHGGCKYDSQSIVSNIIVNATKLDKLKVGKQLDIVIDTKHPEIWNAPLFSFENPNQQQKNWSILIYAGLVITCILLIVVSFFIFYYATTTELYSFVSGLLFEMTIVVIGFSMAAVSIGCSCIINKCRFTKQNKRYQTYKQIIP
eukprot:506788_1